MIALIEDKKWRKLYPHALSRPIWDLRVGVFTIREKYEKLLGEKLTNLFVRNYLKDVVQENLDGYRINDYTGDLILVNSRVIPNREIVERIRTLGKGESLYQGDEFIACRTDNASKYFDEDGEFISCDDLKKHEVQGATLFTYIYQLVHLNPGEILKDARFFDKGIRGGVFDGAYIVNPENVVIEEGAKVYPGVVIDASEGPVIIESGATIMPNATIIGPVYIGRKTRIKVGAKIYEGTSIGPVCKVGGEVEESIIHSYSNKQHDGFLGHAYLGQWVNLGADTNNSDLKNNYSHVRIFIDGEWIDTGEMFVGLMMGDHSKSGINTMFNTGTVVGFSSNIYGGDFPPKFVPSFAWGGSAGFVTYKFEKAVETAERVMARRDVKLTDAYRNLMRKIFELTEKERNF